MTGNSGTTGGQSRNHRDIQITKNRHSYGAGNGCCGENEDVWSEFGLHAQCLTLLNTKAVLFINNN